MSILANYFKVLTRNLWKNKFTSLLNMLGLAIGMTCYLLILQYVNAELSYDKFHVNRDNIYRLQHDSYEDNGAVNHYALTCHNVGPVMKEQFPGVQEATRCVPFSNTTVRSGDKIFKDENILIAEPSFLKIFSVPLLQGDAAAALDGPNKVMLSESTARKYFANEEPMGKTIRILNKRRELSCMVTGIFKDIPPNSHLHYDLLLSLTTIVPPTHSDWVFSTVYTYLLLSPGADPQALEAKFPDFIKKFILPSVPRAAQWKYLLQPLRDIYLYSDLTFDTPNGNGKTVYFLLIIAILILVISWINYINLSTARAMERAREVGTRKVLGSHRFQLAKQFLGEAMLVNIIPLVIAVILAVLCLPFLGKLTGKHIPLNLGSFWFLGHLPLLYLLGSWISGVYPAVVLSSFPPASMLGRSKFTQTSGGRLLRKILVTFQFAASVVLIILALTVSKQINFMTNKDLGCNIQNMMGIVLPTIPLNPEATKNIDSLKTELLRYPAIEKVSGSFTIPGMPTAFQLLVWKENTDFKKGKILSIAFIDEDFMPAYQVRFLAGRNFSKEFGTDNQAVILNEAALEAIGYTSVENAMNQNLSIWTMKESFKIIGIIKNYHQQSLKKSHEPLVFLFNPAVKNFYSVKINPTQKNVSEIVSLVQKKWAEIFPGYPLDYFFLDEFYNRQYKEDYQFGNVLGIFVALAIIITCLGLLGLTYFNTYQRRKEIAIRKSMGANSRDILGSLTGDIVKLTLIGTVIAWPASYWIIDHWLKNYANRIGMPLVFFVLAGLVILFITLLTVAYHTLSASRSNPVEALREE